MVVFLVSAAPVLAQRRPDAPKRDSVTVDTNRVTPGKAFYRSLLIPGWGQASVGSYVRGGTFFGLQMGSAYMLAKTLGKLGEAHSIESRRIGQAKDSLLTLMAKDSAVNRRLSDRTLFNAAVDSTPGVLRVRKLIRSRENQRQDWITYTLVFTLASGVDAFVAAHLATFPGKVEAEPSAGGGMQLKVSLPTGRKP
jgi:hypothetical protein